MLPSVGLDPSKGRNFPGGCLLGRGERTSSHPFLPAAGWRNGGAVGLGPRRRRPGQDPEGTASLGSLRGAARWLLPPWRAATKSRGGGGAAATAGGGRGAAAMARESGGGEPPPLYRREITRSRRGGRGGSGRPSSPRAWRRRSRSSPRSAPAAGTSRPSAPSDGGAEASSRSTMAGSAWCFFAPRISAALGGGRKRRRSAPGPARIPPARPPCRARWHPRGCGGDGIPPAAPARPGRAKPHGEAVEAATRRAASGWPRCTSSPAPDLPRRARPAPRRAHLQARIRGRVLNPPHIFAVRGFVRDLLGPFASGVPAPAVTSFLRRRSEAAGESPRGSLPPRQSPGSATGRFSGESLWTDNWMEFRWGLHRELLQIRV